MGIFKKLSEKEFQSPPPAPLLRRCCYGARDQRGRLTRARLIEKPPRPLQATPP